MLSDQKKLNVWLLVAISLIPLGCYYSFLKVKKTRVISAFNAAVIISLIIAAIWANRGILPLQQVLLITLQIGNAILLFFDAYLVWYFAREMNKAM